MIRINNVDMSGKSFAKTLRAASADIQSQVLSAATSLTNEPMPAKLRFEKLSGYRNPSIYTIHITHNHSHKLSFEIQGTTAILRKIGTHKEIDRAP